jgi:hypothetical protein
MRLIALGVVAVTDPGYGAVLHHPVMFISSAWAQKVCPPYLANTSSVMLGFTKNVQPNLPRFGKHDLPVVAALDNMMRVVLQNSSADPWHTASPCSVVGYGLKDIRGGAENKSVPDFSDSSCSNRFMAKQKSILLTPYPHAGTPRIVRDRHPSSRT